MENKIFRTAVAVFGAVSMLCLLSYFLALHDIYHDYASPEVLKMQTTLGLGALPEWTECPLEWRAIQIAFWPMLLFHILFLTAILSGWIRGKGGGVKDRATAEGK